jgi:hypothetical protein
MNFFERIFQSIQKIRESAILKAAISFGLANREQFESVIEQVRMVDKARDPATNAEISGYQKSIRVAEYLMDHQDRLKLSDDAVEWISLIVKLAWAVAKIRKAI